MPASSIWSLMVCCILRENLALLAPAYPIFHLLIAERIEKTESQGIFFLARGEFCPCPGGAQWAHRSSRVFFGNCLLAVGLKMFQCPHIVQAVASFDEHHTDVIDHGQHHLA